MENYFQITLDREILTGVSALGLAHVGDGVFELLVRTWLCSQGKATAGNLHRATVSHVSATAQAARVDRLLPLLDEDELSWYKRGRNAHVKAVPKNATGEQYSKATGLEALFGALYLRGKTQRINELFVGSME